MSPPDLDFLGQPLEPDGSAGELLKGILEDEAYDDVIFVVAWARFRGLWRLRTELEGIRLGVRRGQACYWPSSSSPEAFVFHDERPGTFRPKLCLARGAQRARLIVGSSNLTRGGLFANVEATLDASFDLPSEEAHPAPV
jgi:hypothetical protein